MSKQAHILLTGGHAATTALGIIEELKNDKNVSWSISWVGSSRSIEGASRKPFEHELFPKIGVSVYSITAAKLQTKFTKNTLPAILRLPKTFFEAFNVLRKVKPNIILSFGGSAALPISFFGWLFKIPVIVHEQTAAAGLSNKIVSNFAKKVAISRESSKDYYPHDKCVVTGNPLMNTVIELTKFETKGEKLFIVGGSRGSQRINEAVIKALPDLLSKFEIIHQTGEIDYEHAVSAKSKLSPSLQRKYQPFSFISPLDIGSIYMETSLMVARSGANTVSEVLALGIPTLFVPIPWARMNEQHENAEFAKKLGIASILDQELLSPEKITEEIISLSKNSQKMKNEYRKNKFTVDIHARAKIHELLLNYI